jgi:predicted RNA-binding Zn-ribbon protein involved in translation (DUF1610 family)
VFTFSSKEDMVKKCTAIAKHSETQLENYQNNVKAGCFECEFNNICRCKACRLEQLNCLLQP